MKRALSVILAAAFVLSAVFVLGCAKKRRETGNIDVDYGKLIEDGGTIMNVLYSDDTPITFMHPSYFSRSSDPEDPFVAKGPDDHSMLMYTARDADEGRTYADIAAYTDEEAQNWITTIQMGLVSSQGIKEIKIDDYKFIKLEDHLYLYLDATVTFNTGYIAKNTVMDYITDRDFIYSVNAYAPLSAVTKYGPLFSDVKYNGVPADSEEAVAGYAEFDNGTVAFTYNTAFSLNETNGKVLAMVPDKMGMLACGAEQSNDERTFEQLAAMTDEEILDYLSKVTAVQVTEASSVKSEEENGVLRLEAEYTFDTESGQTLYCHAVRFIKQDGSVYTVFAYMNEPEPIKDISYNP